MHATTRRTTLVLLASLAGCISTGDPSQANTDDGDTPEPDPHAEPGDPITQTFQFTMGRDLPAGWAFPIRVSFEQYDGEQWIERESFHVDDLDTVTVELSAEERYQVYAKDANGERRMLGGYTPIEPGAERTIRIN